MFITNYQIDQSVLKNPNDVNNSQLVEGKYSKTLIFLLLETFLYGRILFSVGYLFGTFINMESFRTLGVTLSIVSIVIGLSSIYGFDIFNYFWVITSLIKNTIFQFFISFSFNWFQLKKMQVFSQHKKLIKLIN